MTPQEPQDAADRLSAALGTLAGMAASGARCARSAAHVREIAAELHGMAERMGDAVPVAPGIWRVWRAGGTRRRGRLGRIWFSWHLRRLLSLMPPWLPSCHDDHSGG